MNYQFEIRTALHSPSGFKSFAPFASFAFRLLTLMVFGTAVCFAQADYAREKRWADEITPAILVGDPVHLARVDRWQPFPGLFVHLTRG